jgi:hypothetical protein
MFNFYPLSYRSSLHDAEQDELFRHAVYDRDGERSTISSDFNGPAGAMPWFEVFPVGALDTVRQLLESSGDRPHHLTVAQIGPARLYRLHF